VLASRDWHPGVIGIVASRLVDRFQRPTLLIALENGIGQGSGRSVAHFPLHEVLHSCRDHLLQHGGHAMAAGIKVAADQVDAFTNAFLAEAGRRLTPKDLTPKLYLDDEVALENLSTPVVDAFLRLAPFGTGNHRVRLATRAVELAGEPRVVGRNGAHLQFAVRDENELRKAIAFGRGKELEQLAECRRLRLAFEPIINEWQGSRRVELRVLDWQPADD
jgi:single-stranded-DNA-specific exonuclease